MVMTLQNGMDDDDVRDEFNRCRATQHAMGGIIQCELPAHHPGEHEGGNGIVYRKWTWYSESGGSNG